MGKFFPVLYFTHLIFSVTAKLWEAENNNLNRVFELYWHKLQHVLHKNLVQPRKFIITYQLHIIHMALLKAKLLIKCVA